MITADNDLIEQIVANVLAELQPTPTLRAPVVSASAPPAIKVESSVDVDLPVITAPLLAERVRPGQTVRIGKKSILTPSARDWLGSRKILWSRISSLVSTSSTNSARWQLMFTTVTPVVSTLRQSLAGWKTELLGTAKEAAEHAVRVVCTGEADGLLGICDLPETIACLANRNPKVRAAVVSTAGDLASLAEQLSPNVLVINPRGKSFVELKNVLRAVAALSKPAEPLWK